jgi:N-acetylmuramoyl-L-alanine amidase
MRTAPALIFYFLISALLISACSINPYNKTNKIYRKKAKQFAGEIGRKELRIIEAAGLKAPPVFVGTVNFNLRKPNFVIIHHTAQKACEQTLKTFTLEKTQVSAHYVICKDGTIYHMLNDYLRAWHGGTGKWGNLTDINSVSLGIELDNDGFEPFGENQISSLLDLLSILKKNYNIPTSNFIGHSDIAPGRKVDPNKYFPWKRLADAGFGLWYDDLLEVADSTFNPQIALRLIGYDMKDPKAAISAFKLHFIQSDLNTSLTKLDSNVMNNLSKKY